MLKKYERYFQYHYLDIERTPKHAPPIPLMEIYGYLKHRIEDNKSFKLYDGDTNEIRIKTTKVLEETENGNPKSIVFLLMYTDTDIGNPAYSKLKKTKVQIKELDDQEGVACSAHILITSEPLNGDNGFRYLVLLEEVPGLGRISIQKFFRREFKDAIERRKVWLDPQNKNRKEPTVYKPYVTIDLSLPENENSAGRIVGFTLSQAKTAKESLDEEIDVKLQTIEMKYSMTALPKVKDFFTYVKEFAVKKRADYIKIRYKNRHGRQQTAIMGVTASDISDMLAARKEKVKLTSPIPQCSEEINDSIVEKMHQFAGNLIKEHSGDSQA